MSKSQKMDDIRVFALRPDSKLNKPHRLVVDIPIPGAKQTYTKPAKSVSTPAVAAPSAKTYDVSDKAKNVLKGKIICLDPGHGGTVLSDTLAKRIFMRRISPSPSLFRSGIF